MATELTILHQGAIGDFLLTLPVIQAARQALGSDKTTAVANAPSARLAAGRGVVDAWVSPELVGLHRLFCRDLPLTDGLAEIVESSDYVLSFLGGAGESIHQRLAEQIRAREDASGRPALVSVDPRPNGQTRQHRRHITMQWTLAIRDAGWDISDPEPSFISIEKGQSRRRDKVLVHPGSGGRIKCWPLNRFFELADRLSHFDLTWMLGPAEVQEARRVHERDEPLLVEEDLVEAAEQMAGFSLYIGNDSGITHLAAALGLPTVAIFAATDPCIWRPLGDHVRVVAPDRLDESMQAIEVDQVYRAVREVLA